MTFFPQLVAKKKYAQAYASKARWLTKTAAEPLHSLLLEIMTVLRAQKRATCYFTNNLWGYTVHSTSSYYSHPVDYIPLPERAYGSSPCALCEPLLLHASQSAAVAMDKLLSSAQSLVCMAAAIRHCCHSRLYSLQVAAVAGWFAVAHCPQLQPLGICCQD